MGSGRIAWRAKFYVFMTTPGIMTECAMYHPTGALLLAFVIHIQLSSAVRYYR